MLKDILTNIVAVGFVLGIMIFIHELGHFLAAKYFGIRVDVFSLGFGKRLFGFRRGETDYRISLLPLGGYVKMAGEQPTDAVTGSADEFQSKPRWQRFIVAVMGPTMNILLAIVLLTGLFMFRYQKPAYQEGPAVIGWIEADSPAAQAGFQVGDRIVRVDDEENPGWGDVELTVASNAGRELHVYVDRGGENVMRSLVPRAEGRSELGYAGWTAKAPAVLLQIAPGLPAEKAGLQPDDQLISINGVPVPDWPWAIPEVVQKNQGKPMEIVYLRGGEQRTATLTPEMSSAQGEPQQRWMIGVSFKYEMITRQLSFTQALSESVATNKKFALLIFQFVGKIITMELSTRTLEGPIGIARLSGAAARQGVGDLVSLMAAISLNLGIFNLFPIPVLDGGLIFMLLIEGIRRKDLSQRTRELVTQVGFGFLMLLVVFVLYNDIVKTLPERLVRYFP